MLVVVTNATVRSNTMTTTIPFARRPGFNAQNKMLDEHAERYKLQDQVWRKRKPWYEPEKSKK